MILNKSLILEIEFKSLPSDEDFKKFDGSIKKMDYNKYTGDRSITIINNEVELFDSKHRVDILTHLPKWFDFHLFRIYLISF